MKSYTVTYTLLIPYRLLDEAHKQVSTPELQDTEWDEVVPDILQSHLHNIPVEIVQQNEHFDPRHREPSSAPELVTDTNQASGGMGTQVADGKKALSGTCMGMASYRYNTILYSTIA